MNFFMISGKMVPVDEYITIMFDQNPNQQWKNNFKKRNLIAYSTDPLLVQPTYHDGEVGHVSDTENSSKFHTEL